MIGAYKLWYGYLPHIPKIARYTLAEKTDRLFIELIEYVFIASKTEKNQKLPILQRASNKLELFKFFLQILWETKALENTKYIALSQSMDEAGRMLGGWIRQTIVKTQSAENKK